MTNRRARSRYMQPSLCLLLVSWTAGCGDGAAPAADAAQTQADAAHSDAAQADAGGQIVPDAGPPPGIHQYVINFVDVPFAGNEHVALGLDIDGDGAVDNQVGLIQVALATNVGIDLQLRSDALINGGEQLDLIEVRTASLEDQARAELELLQGADRDEVNSDNFTGREPFDVLPGSPANNYVSGPISGGTLDMGQGPLIVRSVALGTELVQLPLIGARVTGSIDESGIMTGVIGGGIAQADVSAIVLPAFTEMLNDTVADTCVNPAPDCCLEGSTGESILALFDTDANCQLSIDEIEGNGFIGALTAPDLDLLDASGQFAPNQDGVYDALSIGFGFTAVGAVFTIP